MRSSPQHAYILRSLCLSLRKYYVLGGFGDQMRGVALTPVDDVHQHLQHALVAPSLAEVYGVDNDLRNTFVKSGVP